MEQDAAVPQRQRLTYAIHKDGLNRYDIRIENTLIPLLFSCSIMKTNPFYYISCLTLLETNELFAWNLVVASHENGYVVFLL